MYHHPYCNHSNLYIVLLVYYAGTPGIACLFSCGMDSVLGRICTSRQEGAQVSKLYLPVTVYETVLRFGALTCRFYDPKTYPFPDYSKQFLGLANTLFIPMWVFVASGLAVYVSLALHIIVWHQNIRHILHSLVSSAMNNM